jgi:hypothetical protein
MLRWSGLAEHAGQMVPKDRLFQRAARRLPSPAMSSPAVSELRRLFEDMILAAALSSEPS